GQSREASEDSLLAVIAALGLPAEPAQALAELEEVRHAAPLGLGSTSLVHAEDPHPEIELRVPARARAIDWACRLETGEERRGAVGLDAAAAELHVALPLPADLPAGYHRLTLEAGGAAAEIGLIVAPECCHLPRQLGPGARSWGLTCQLYGLRRAGDWGIGDLSGLAKLAELAGSHGAAVLGINPLHARFADDPVRCSPYAPSSRIWLDYLCIDPTAVPGFAEDASVRALVAGDWFDAARQAACAAPLVDYPAVAACKRRVLEALWRRFRTLDLDSDGGARTPLGAGFCRFARDGGRSLIDFTVFETLHEHHARDRGQFSWRDWPAPLRDPRSPEVAAFAAAHRERVGFFTFLQWQADCQLAAAAGAARAGLSIGLYRDLAVGADPDGADAWADQALVVRRAAIGAPPDVLSRSGQNWGLAPLHPLVLRRQGYAPFIACLRANMAHAGILRIDHVMSLSRLYWVPDGMAANNGCYVRYPFEDLLRLVALESGRHGCAVIGEDLGTVPIGFRETMQRANVLSYRILMFERHSDGGLASPGEYPPLAAAAAATHDLATIKGFWLGRDIDWRGRLGLYPDAAAQTADRDGRARDRTLLLEALVAEGLLGPEQPSRLFSESGAPIYSALLGEAMQRYLAGSRARLMLMQLEDVVGEDEQANLPGTTVAHPNWRRRLHLTLDEIAGGAQLRHLAQVVNAARRRSAAR
ncbi:MAG TPA: 4-alpha-glucanotransferase, partial [Stellaceae bacterium]|nr:4-alpha-glucanotransferase [Stellaceae bacterium]